jgi:hypothetical protein
MNADSRASSHGGRRAAIPVAIVLLALLAVLVAPSLALASSVTDAGEGFPLSVNASDHILIAKLVIEEEEGKSEENIAGPWSIWAGGSSTPLAPLNGGPETKEVALGEPEHSVFLYRLNAAGVAGGTSTITSGFKEGKEHTVHRAAYYTPDGVGHEVPPLYETITNSKGEPVTVGAIGTGIDGAGDVAGLGVVKVGEHARSRGFFSAGGTAHPSVVGESDGPWTEVFSMNEAGTMFGSVSEMKITETEEGKTEEEPVHPKYALWKTPGGSATILNFDAPLAGFPLADDGSVLGYLAGKLLLREPSGTETEVAGLSKPFAVNSSHVVVGSKSVGGVEHAAVWQAGTVSDLNALLPEKSGWVLQRAVAINDGGDIAGIGTHEGHTHVFLLKTGIVVTNAGDEKESSKAGSGVCATEESGCTLRAAIETVNKAANAAVTPISFNVADGKPAEIAPSSALPAITAPINIEGASQPGAYEESGAEGGRKVGVIIDGTKAGPDGLVLESAGSIVSGLVLKNFGGGAGVLLKGEHEQLADSVLYKDKVGVEVAGSNDVIGPSEELAGNNFVEDGDTAGLASYVSGLKPGTAPKAYDEAVAGFGAAVLLGKGPTSGTQITGNLIGLAGGLKSALSLTAGVSTFGVLVDPGSGVVENVTIGGAASAKNLISGDFTGVELLGSAGGSVAGVSVLGNQIGGDRGVSGESELGTIIGLMAEGKVTGLQVGSAASGNTFPADIIGAVLAGGELTGASVQNNTFGVDKGLKSFEGGKLEGHDILGIVAADTTGAQIGGTPGAGNRVLGAPLGIVLAGEKSSKNRVESNTIGRNAPPAGPFDLSEKSFDTGEFGGILGLLDASGSEQQIGSAGAGNTIQGNLVGLFSAEEKNDTVQGNAIVKNGFGFLDFDSGGTRLGGGAAGQGNQILSSAIGALISNINPTKQELEDAQASEKSISSSVRKETLNETPKENQALADVNGTTTAALTEALFEPPSKPGTNNRIEGNLIGTNAAGDTRNASGETLGSAISLLISGDEQEVQVGGTGAGQGNHIVNGGSGGLLVAGTAAHAPSVQALGNTIYNNSTFGGAAVGIPGLGINLIRVQGSGEIDPVFGFTVDPQDPIQPDVGPNGLQNSPVLTSATSAGGTLTVVGTLQSAPNTSYTIELFSDEFKNPYGAGEGQQILGRFNIATDAAGHASFTATEPAPGAGAQYVSATATTLPAGGKTGVTSEFALDAKIEAVPAASGPTPTPTPTTPTGPSPAPAPAGVTTTGIVEHSGTLTVTVSALTLTLPGVTVDCAASGPGCAATATATEGGSGKASAAAHAKPKPLVVLARWSARLAPGHAAPVILTLTRKGHTLLLRKHLLTLTVVVSVKAGAGRAVTRTLHVHVRLKAKRKGH